MRSKVISALLIVVGLVGLGAALAPAAQAESTSSAFASRLITLVNAARAAHGLRALTVASGTSTVAAGWTAHLAAQQALSHNPDLGPQLESHGSANWTAYGENVGEGPTSSAQKLFDAYMNSPEHRANILGSAYRYLGIGVVFTGTLAWNTMDFVDEYSWSTHPTTSTPVVHHTTTPSAPVHTVLQRPARVVHVSRHATAKPTRPARRHPAAAQRVQVEALASTHPVAEALVPATTSAPVHVPSPGHTLVPVLVAVGAIVAGALRFVPVLRARSA